MERCHVIMFLFLRHLVENNQHYTVSLAYLSLTLTDLVLHVDANVLERSPVLLIDILLDVFWCLQLHPFIFSTLELHQEL